MKVMIAGGSGMIGKRLAKSLLEKDHEVWILSRNPNSVSIMPGLHVIKWDGKTTIGWGDLLGKMDVFVNLVGERLAKWPWTKAQKQRFLSSRIECGLLLAEALKLSPHPPSVFVQASGINYYGPRGKEIITETEPAGEDFLARLCVDWENSTLSLEKLGVRRVIIRSAVVLSSQEGILPIMMLPLRYFLGGPLGKGDQGFPWIHLDDEVSAIEYLMFNSSARGPYNLTAPNPISFTSFLVKLAGMLNRPYWLPVPSFILRIFLGGMSTLLLDGQYVLPDRLIKLGFQFKYRELEHALNNLLQIK